MKYPGFVGQCYQSTSWMADSEDTINLFLETSESKTAPTPDCLIGTPGFVSVTSSSEGPGRGSIAIGSREYFVQGYRVYEWDGMTLTARATLSAADTRPATLSWNGPAGGQLFITSGDVGYILDLTTFVLTIVLASGASMGAYLDGYFLAIDAATGTLQISDLLDGLTWDPTQIATRSQAPDPWVALTVIHAEIWLLGSLTSEVWANAGTFPFPFEPIQGALLEQGIAAPFSLTRDVSPLVWVSANAQGARMVLMANGYAGQRISTYGIEQELNRYTTVADALSCSFQIAGHTFAALIFPTADTSWLYDFGERQWYKWRYWNTLTSAWEAVRVRTHVLTADGLHLMQDRASGTIYRMGMDLYSDVDGSVILRERTPPRLSAPDQVRFIVDEIQVIMDVGIGTIGTDDTDPDVNPNAMLSTSRDGGKVYGPERTAAIGKVGQYTTRVFWTNGGQARNRSDRFRFACRRPIRLVEALVKVRVGTS